MDNYTETKQLSHIAIKDGRTGKTIEFDTDAVVIVANDVSDDQSLIFSCHDENQETNTLLVYARLVAYLSVVFEEEPEIFGFALRFLTEMRNEIKGENNE